jgi:hypothetical protein
VELVHGGEVFDCEMLDILPCLGQGAKQAFE